MENSAQDASKDYLLDITTNNDGNLEDNTLKSQFRLGANFGNGNQALAKVKKPQLTIPGEDTSRTLGATTMNSLRV